MGCSCWISSRGFSCDHDTWILLLQANGLDLFAFPGDKEKRVRDQAFPDFYFGYIEFIYLKFFTSLQSTGPNYK